MNIERTFPQLPVSGPKPRRSISFVVVRYSNEYLHNFLRSECVGNDLNEVIEVDNTGNLFFDNLSQAMIFGMNKAHHDLIAFVHEDVRLVDGWQVQFERSLAELAKHDDQWAMLGSVGWSNGGDVCGHWSDPFNYKNTFDGKKKSFTEVSRLDEQMLIFHRLRLPIFDTDLPGIHHIGKDLSIGMRKMGLRTYAVNAPTIHKYKDRNGHKVVCHEESEKIKDRKSLTYLADKACCDNYISSKWPELKHLYKVQNEFQIPLEQPRKQAQLDQPIILISRGGSGSRLLSYMVEDAGVFLGNELNGAGDSLELVIPFYRAITEKFRCRADWQKKQSVPRIKAAAALMINDLPEDRAWGFKLPESILLLPELIAAFPKATYIHLVRDPQTTCLRRTHMTARLDNHIGRITLPLAYDYFNINRSQILHDNPAEHMAYTTMHQLELVEDIKIRIPKQRFLLIRFENLIAKPQVEMTRLCNWLKVGQKAHRKEGWIDIHRATNPKTVYPESVVTNVKHMLVDLRRRLNYENNV